MNSLHQRLHEMSAVKLALAAESARPKLDLLQAEPIAIIGMGCRFPAGADDPESFWNLLRNGMDAVSEVPPERWDIDAYYDADPEAVGKMYTRWGSFLQNVDHFDASFFGISPREAALMDPQQRLMLEVSWEAVERAALPPSKLRASRTGIFVGMMTLDYSRLLDGPNLMSPYAATGNGLAFTAGRLAYTLGLHGPAIAVDTACSSSLVAVHLACQSLRMNECEAALAAGVNLSFSPVSTLVQCRARMLSPDGRCKTFDASANGYVKGEGCGVVLLKRLADAIRDGDRILALIRGSAVNHDGASSGITVPNQTAQEQVMRSALESGGVASSQVSYVEAHGTGTSLGDPIEIEALGAVYGAGRDALDPLVVSSVKTNLGHLEGAAGIAGLIKAILALEHEEIPPHLHLQTPSPHIRWSDLPITVPTERRPWKRGAQGRFAGVSSFGFSGTNAHIILEEAPELGAQQLTEHGSRLLAFSAKTADALESLAGYYVRYLDDHPRTDLADLCFTANTGRTHFPHRLTVTARDTSDLKEKLRAVRLPAGPAHKPLRSAFLYSGNPFSEGVGHELALSYPVFREAFEKYGANSDTDSADRTFAFQQALTSLWCSWGVIPAFSIGDGAGQYAAACAIGSLQPDIARKALRSRSGAEGKSNPAPSFAPAVTVSNIQEIVRKGANLFIEIGPTDDLIRLVRTWIDDPAIVFAASLHSELHERRTMLEALAAFYQMGGQVQWAAVERERRHKLVLPTYPFERQRHWLEPVPLANISKSQERYPGEHPLLGRRILLPASEEVRFESQLSAESPAFLNDHRVYGEIVVPAAVYLEMAVAAARQTLAADCLLLEDIVFHQALRLGHESAATIQLVCAPAESGKRHWTIYAAESPDENSQWRALASGTVSNADRTEHGVIAPGELEADAQSLSVESHYDLLRLHGLEYGTAFRALTKIEFTAGAAWGSVELPAILKPEEAKFSFHPVAIDACFQLCAAALGLDDESASLGKASVPVSIERVRILGKFPAGAMRAHARISDAPARHGAFVGAQLRIHADNGFLLAEIDGLVFRSVEQQSLIPTASSQAEPDHVYEVQWKEQSLPAESASHLPTPSLIKSSMASFINDIGNRVHADSGLDLIAKLEELSLHYIAEGFLQLGWPYRAGDRFTTASAAEDLGVIQRYHGLLMRLLSALCDVGCLVRDDHGWSVKGSLPPGEGRQAMHAILESHPEATAEIALLDRCASKWPAVVRGACDPLTLLFPSGNSSGVAQIYRSSADLAILNSLIAEIIRVIATGQPVKVLEIGGGTGATTAQILKKLDPDELDPKRAEYTFTDVSSALIAHARRTLGEHSFIEYRALDIERSPQTQGFASHAHNIVIAANVFHATRDINETLRHVRELLAPNGLLVLLEATTPLRWLDLTFGLTAGWWRFNDHDLRPSYPLLSGSAWTRVLAENGFHETAAIEPIPNHAILIARSAPRPRRWLLAGPEGDFAAKLSGSLVESGDVCTLHSVHPESMGYFEAMRSAIEEAQPDGIVFLWGLDTPEARIADDAKAEPQALPRVDPPHAALQCSAWALRSIQAILKATTATSPSLFLVTRGAAADGVSVPGVAPGLAQAPLWGLGAVAALEHPELRCTVVDLGSKPRADSVTALAAEIRAASNENRVSLDANRRKVARLVPVRKISRQVGPLDPDGSYLIAGGFGGLGLLTASWLVSRGARNLILAGRRGLHPEARAAVDALQASGALIRIQSIDIARSEQLERMFAEIACSLPPLKGVIHAAGNLDDGIILEQTPERFAALFASKVAGSWNLHRFTLGLPLDFFVMFSSAASLVGRPGQSNHAAANAFMDALAHHRRANGLPGLSINWGAWSSIGKAVEVEADRVLESQGAHAISPEQGLAILEKLLSTNLVQAAVLPMDWELFRRKLPASAAMALLEDLIRPHDRGLPRQAEAPPPLRAELLNTAGLDRVQWIATYLQERIGAILGLRLTSHHDLDQPLQELGFDSLMGIELKSRVNQELGVNLPIVDLMETPTIQQLSVRLAEQLTLAERVILTHDVSNPALDLITL